MNTERELIQQLRDALHDAVCYISGPIPKKALAGIATADAYLSKQDWIRVEDSLPVVPVDHEDVDVYTFDGVTVDEASFVSSEAWTGFTSDCRGTPVSHWQYRQAPQPPEGSK